MDKRKLSRWIAVALAVAFCFWQPHLRAVTLFVLPLGSGIDDLIVIVALVFAAVGYVLYLTNGRFWMFENKEHPKRRQAHTDDGLETFEAKKGK